MQNILLSYDAVFEYYLLKIGHHEDFYQFKNHNTLKNTQYFFKSFKRSLKQIFIILYKLTMKWLSSRMTRIGLSNDGYSKAINKSLIDRLILIIKICVKWVSKAIWFKWSGIRNLILNISLIELLKQISRIILVRQRQLMSICV